ncbi:MAG TPA: hypothetical protein DDW91_06855 [Shewanella frigidimarina]|nr:hypothetical protein [Shewanella frigidimarina]
MPVKNANQVKANLRKAVAKIDKKAVQFVQAVINDAGILSKTKAPLAYGLLVSSQSQDFEKSKTSYIGKLSYNTLYASILNDGVYKWKPKAPPKYGNAKKGISPATAWNPESTPHFLEYGFESPEAKTMIDANMRLLKI